MIESVQVTIERNGHVERTVPLRSGTTRMGRAEDNGIVLSDVGVSRYHAQVNVTSDEVLVEDLRSGNGTYYFGHRIKAQPLRDGDEIVIDPFVLKFHIDGAVTASLPPVKNNHGVRLEVIVGTGLEGKSYPIGERGLTMGRAEDRDVVLPDPASSRNHCHIEPVAGEYVLYDNASANGIFVNSVRVHECTLTDGDLVRIGNTELRFVRYDRAPAADMSTSGQVPMDVWNPQAGQTDYVTTATESYDAPQQAGSSWLPLVAAVALFGMLVLFVLAVGAIVVALELRQPAVITAIPHAPRWTLQIPARPEASADTLWNTAFEDLNKGRQTEALEKFYRLLEVHSDSPGSVGGPEPANVKKFALFTGQALMLGDLYATVSKADQERVLRQQERDRLFRDLNSRSRRTRTAAKRRLVTDFSDDPEVKKRLDLADSNAVIGQYQMLKQSEEFRAAGKYREAVALCDDVLKDSKSPVVREEALKIRRKAIERSMPTTQSLWEQAVVADMEGDNLQAQSLLSELQQVVALPGPVELRQNRLTTD